MPNSQYSLDACFPQFTGQESDRQRVIMIYDYLIQLQQTLQYCMQNLGSDNFNDTELEIIGKTIREPVYIRLTGVEKETAYISLEASELTARMEDAEGNISQLQSDATGFSSRLEDAEGNISQLQADAMGYSLEVTNGKKSSTLKLLAGETVLSSQDITFEGVVTFTAEDDGYSKIDGGYLRCVNIDAEKIVGQSLYAELPDGEEFTRMNPNGIHFGSYSLDSVYVGSVAAVGNVLKMEGYMDGGIEIISMGAITIGKSGNALNLVGNVYVNGNLIS